MTMLPGSGKTSLFAGEVAKHNAVLRELWIVWKHERATRERIRIVDIPPYKKIFARGRGFHG